MRQTSMANRRRALGTPVPLRLFLLIHQAFGPIDRARPGRPEAVPIKMLVVDLLQDLRASPSCWRRTLPKPQIKDARRRWLRLFLQLGLLMNGRFSQKPSFSRGSVAA